MSEVKFTEQELQSLQELSVKSNEITNRFGQLAIAKINLEKQSEQVSEEEFRLHEELEALKTEEQETLKKITDKYGPGTLDPSTGVFTPSVEVQASEQEK
jgi:small-conductance mechanosensitive channel|tara:strand:+ start:287 stop:586 length:300 start_codon:yes stop_codon:yes gene_type:complete